MQKRFVLLALLCLVCTPLCKSAQAEDYPSRVVRVILPFSVGGTSDLIARIIFDKIGEQSNFKSLIENRPGGAGNIATEAVVRSPADGYTLYLADPTGFLSANVTLFPKTPFNPATDLTPVILVGATRAVVVVSSKTEIKNIPDLIALSKSQPGGIRYGSTGIGSPGHLNGELFKRLLGIEMTHIPYRLIPQGVGDLISGQISLWVGPAPTFVSFIRSGQMRALAVSGDTRSSEFPDVPTVNEAGFGNFDVSNLYALYVPTGTPPEVIATIRQRVERAVAMPDVAAKLKTAGVEPATGDASFLQRTFNNKVKQWADVINQAGIRPDGQN